MHQATRRIVTWLAIAPVVTFALAGCSGGSRKAGRAPAPAASPLEIGFLGAVSGADAQLGVDIVDGEDLAIVQYDRTDPRYPVSLDVSDSRGDPSVAKDGAAKLIRDGDLAVIGPAFAGESVVADPMFEQARIPDISASATNVDLAQHGWRYFHRVVADDGAQGRGAGDYLVKTLKARMVEVVDDGSSYGTGLATSVADQVRADGGTVATAHVDPSGGGDGQAIRGILTAHPSAVFYAGFYDGAGRLAEQLRTGGYRGVFMSGDGSDDPRFVTAAGGRPGRGGPAEGSYLTCACADPTNDHAASSFVRAYKAMYHTAPGVFSAEAYDATNFVLAAIASGDTTAVAINNYLASNSYQGITKRIKFLPDGNVSGGTVFVYRVEGGRITEIGTTN